MPVDTMRLVPLIALALLAVSALASPKITIEPEVAEPGDTVTITIEDSFYSFCIVEVRNTNGDLLYNTTVRLNSGRAVVTWRVPLNVRSGDYVINVICKASTYQSSHYLKVVKVEPPCLVGGEVYKDRGAWVTTLVAAALLAALSTLLRQRIAAVWAHS